MMVRLLKLFVAITILLSKEIYCKSNYWRVANGKNALSGRYPFIVSLQEREYHFCGGTIVNPSWILTTAHCVATKNAKNLQVIYGITDLKESMQKLETVTNIIIHEKYTRIGNQLTNDVGLLRLASPLWFEYGRVGQVTLAGKGFKIPITEGTRVKLLGWGSRYEQGPLVDQLQELEEYIFADDYCKERFPFIMDSNQFCTGTPNGGKGQCSGDSGGPVLVTDGSRYYQVGIISSSSKPCAGKNHVGISLIVPNYSDWIHKFI